MICWIESPTLGAVDWLENLRFSSLHQENDGLNFPEMLSILISIVIHFKKFPLLQVPFPLLRFLSKNYYIQNMTHLQNQSIYHSIQIPALWSFEKVLLVMVFLDIRSIVNLGLQVSDLPSSTSGKVSNQSNTFRINVNRLNGWIRILNVRKNIYNSNCC